MSDKGLAKFMSLYPFGTGNAKDKLQNHVLTSGVEREFRITTLDGQIVPEAPRVLRKIWASSPKLKDQFVPEFSGCVVESKTRPCATIPALREQLVRRDKVLKKALRRLKLTYSLQEVGPTDMPLVINENEERFRELLKKFTLAETMAACRIIGTHVHTGKLRDHESALRVYNRFVRYWPVLAKLGSNSGDRRIWTYSLIKTGHVPIEYSSWEKFYEDAQEKGFADNPKNNWALIRLTTHGTVEVRVFGTTDNINTVCRWVKTCRWLAKSELDGKHDEEILAKLTDWLQKEPTEEDAY